jgi:hypothetical protein
MLHTKKHCCNVEYKNTAAMMHTNKNTACCNAAHTNTAVMLHTKITAAMLHTKKHS